MIRLEHLAHESGHGRLSVRARDPDEGLLEFAYREFNFRGNGNALQLGLLQKLMIQHVHTRADQDQLGPEERFFGVATEFELDLEVSELLQAVGQLGALLGVGDHHPCALFDQEFGRGHPGGATADDQYFFTFEFTHVCLPLKNQRSLRVAKVASARMIEMIQNRTMTFGSAQPLSS